MPNLGTLPTLETRELWRAVEISLYSVEKLWFPDFYPCIKAIYAVNIKIIIACRPRDISSQKETVGRDIEIVEGILLSRLMSN